MAAHLSDIVPLICTGVLPLSGFISFSIYLSTHPESPSRKFIRKRKPIALPTHRAEALDGTVDLPEKDAFDIDDPIVREDGIPVDAERFWASMWRRKVLLLLTLLLPFACNIVSLVFTALSKQYSGDRKTIALFSPIFILAAHFPTLILAISFLPHNYTAANWQTTIHLSTNLFIQFLVISLLALLPSSPLPTEPSSSLSLAQLPILGQLPKATPLGVTRFLLPVLQLIPLLVATILIRRGPALHLPLSSIYPQKVVEAVPPLHESLDSTKANVSSEVQVNILGWIYFSYATAFIQKGAKSETMDLWDVPILPSSLRALDNFLALRRAYGKPGVATKWQGYHLLWKLTKVNAGLIISMLVLAGTTAVVYYVPHYIMKLFISYLEGDPSRSNPAWGWFLAFALFVSNAIMFAATGVTWSIVGTFLQARIQLQLNGLLFSKTLTKKDVASGGDNKKNVPTKKDGEGSTDKESEDAEEENVTSKSQIMNLFTVDVDRVKDFVFHAFSIIDAPIEIIVAAIFLVNLLGTSALWGLLTSILCMPLTHFASKFVVKVQENLMKARDKRTGLMNEILQGVRMLKFMAWERSFEARVNSIRKDELFWQARNFQIEVGFNCIWELAPVLVTVVSFIHYTLIAGHSLTPSVAFTAIAVFSELRFALSSLPETFIQALQGFVSCQRIERYMSQPDIIYNDDYDGQGDIALANVTFTWPRDATAEDTHSVVATPKDTFTLADLSLRFPRGKLSLVCGRLGSGKSLLLAGLLGEADILAGHVECPRSAPDIMDLFEDNVSDENWIIPTAVGYVPQQAWLQNASIKDNIVFSSPWNPVRYQAVLEACSLLSDLEILEDGDETEIGEKGLNLSGGQKARVSLARAIYSRAGTLLLDDVLSAVDAHTAHAIMENCFNGPITDGRTIILVSHHTALVSPSAAYIVALENGDVKFSGSRADFVAGGLMLALEAEDPQSKLEDKLTEEVEEETKAEVDTKPSNKSLVNLSHAAQDSEPTSETSSLAPDDEHTLTSSTPELKVKAPRKLVEDEKRATGRIAKAVWMTYFTSLGGYFWWTAFSTAIVLAMLVPVAEKGWLGYWTSGSGNEHSPLYYVIGYTLISMSGVWAYNLQFAIMYYGSLKASAKLHSEMLKAVLFAPLRFHDTTSRGRLLNRFGKDIEGLDSEMADNFARSLTYGMHVIVTFCSILYIGGWPFFAGTAVILVLYYKAGSIYGQTSRDMRRLNSVTRSPLYSLFAETVSGVSVIRAFGASTIALRSMLKLSDMNVVAFAWSWTVNRWLSARYNILSSFVVGFTALACLLAPGVTAAQAGFALAFANTLYHDLLFVVRRFVQLEQSMVALERIKEYSELAQEAPEFIEPRPPASWPHGGSITVEKLAVRYAPDLPNVLHGISFEVNAREKIGIVGATGCGKSTLALSFFRFVEAYSGKITIDGIDIAKIGLTDLRSRVTIIPQDPTILSGSLRSTLDVFDEYDDADIYAALRRVHLLQDDESTQGAEHGILDDEGRNKNVFRDLSNPVSEGGDNFSTGEKQLICMARAILRRNKLLLMDEATASIDYETDALISKTIREEFSESTILTIAHRIHTIIDFDKVLVMDKGRISEFASPAELLRDHKSRFYGLCKATGKTEFKNLKTMAAEAERQRKAAGTSAST